MTPEIEKRIKMVQAGKVPAGKILDERGETRDERKELLPKLNVWPKVKLEDIFDEVCEKNHPEADVLTIIQGVGTVLRSESGREIIYDKDSLASYKYVRKGDFIIHLRSFEGGLEMANQNGIVSPAYIILHPKVPVSSIYLYALFHSNKFINQTMAPAVEGARDGRSVKYEVLKKQKILFPSLPEQEKIAEILAAQDKVVELKENLIAEKQTQKNYLMDQLFSGQKRLVGKTESFVSSAIGSVPSDWKLFLFETLFDVCKEHTENLIEYPLYSLTIENGVTPKTERYERQHLVKKENVYKILKPKYFAYNPMNIRFGAIGLHKKEFPVAVSGYYDTFTCKDPSILIFMEHFLKSDAMLNYYDKVSTGSLIEKKRVHLSQFLSFELPLPSIEEMRAIAKVLSAADEEISLLQKDLEQEKLKKKSLMQLLLTGLVRVSA